MQGKKSMITLKLCKSMPRGVVYLALTGLLPWPPSPALLGQASSEGVSQGEHPTTLRVDVNEIAVGCIAEDSHTSPIRGLRKQDFIVIVDGQPIPLRLLETDADVPLNVSLLIDVSISQHGMLENYSNAVRGLKTLLRPGRDRVSIYTFGGAVRLYRDWEDIGALDVKEIEHLDPKAGVELQKKPLHFLGGTRLFDAIQDAIRKSTPVKGRKAILVLTDGVDEGSDTTSASALKAGELGNVSISALEFGPRGAVFLSPSLVATKIHDSLAAISTASGGIFLHAKHGEETGDCSPA